MTLAEVVASLRERPEGSPYTVQQAAEYLGISKTTVYELLNSGQLASYRIGEGRGTIRIRPGDLAAFQREAHRGGEFESERQSVTLTDLRKLR